MAGFKFIHTADIHLDTPFQGLASDNPVLRKYLAGATFAAFRRIVDLCLDYQVDFLLVAGDVYDAANRSLRAQVFLREQLSRLAERGIRTFIVHGNHDHCSGRQLELSWPPEVYFFAPGAVEHVPFILNGKEIARIYGISYPEAQVTEDYSRLFQRHDDVPFAIGILHSNVGGNVEHENYAPCTLDSLIGKGFDYWALGHIHSSRVLRQKTPTIVYPGTPQGRNPRETGPKGCYLVEVYENREVTLRFLETDIIRWHRQELSIEGMSREDELLEALQTRITELKAANKGRSGLVRFVVSGRGPLYSQLKKDSFVEDIVTILRESERLDGQQFVWVDSLQIRANPPVDKQQLLEDENLLADFLQLVQKAREDTDFLNQLAENLSPLWEHRRAKRFLPELTVDELKAMLELAENMGIHLLLGEGNRQ